MKIVVASFICVLLAGASILAQEETEKKKPAETAPKLETVKDKVSYGIGRNIGSQFARQELDLNLDAFALGIKDALKKAKSRVTDEDLEAAMASFQRDLRRKAALRRINADPELKALAEKNAKAGKEFLAANEKKEGVKKTKSGLQYKVTKAGTGKSPEANSSVRVHYHGTLPDGTVFDSSVEREEPAEFPLGGVIAGWTEGLQLMKEGGKWTFYVPSNLAYDLQQKSEKIGPNQVLVFEVELLKVLD